MYDGSKSFYPLLKNMKTQKHQIRKTEEGKGRKVCLRGRLLFLAAMDNVNNLNWGKKPAHSTACNTTEKSGHILSITISSFAKQSDRACFLSFFQVLHVASVVLLKQFIASKGKWSLDWFIKPSIYRLYKHMPPFHLRLAILAITKQHYTICDDISNWPSFRKGMKQNINKLEQTTGRHNNCSVTLTSPNTLLHTQVLLAFLVSSLKSKTFQ